MNPFVNAARKRIFLGLLGSLALIVGAGQSNLVNADPSAWSPPSAIQSGQLRMRKLTNSGASLGLDCAPGNTEYGCTAYCDNYPYSYCQGNVAGYPYASAWPTISYDHDYLLDVLAQEASPALFDQLALNAQAIASRSYAWHRINSEGVINNSSSYQVFIPYKFETFGSDPNAPGAPCASSNLSAGQRKLCDAVASGYYLSWEDASNWDYEPARANFFADTKHSTASSGDKPYLIGVSEPHSNDNATCPASYASAINYGMSQQGAHRWATGNQCGPFYTASSLPWGVRWTRTEQILYHYYTRMVIRDRYKMPVWTSSQTYRWNPLQITWGGSVSPPAWMRTGSSYPVVIDAQNVGLGPWSCANGAFYLTWRWQRADQPAGAWKMYNGPGTLCDLAPGGNRAVSLTVDDAPSGNDGQYALQFDVAYRYYDGTGTGYFVYGGWPTYDVAVNVDSTPPNIALYLNNQSPPFPSWYNIPVQVRLSATDAGGSGVNRIVYRVAYSPWQTAYGSEVTLWLANDGWQQIDYYAVDNAGNVEPQRGQMTQIDQTAPSAPAAAAEAHGVTHNVWQNGVAAPTFTWDAGADLTSGVAQYQARVANQQTGAVIADATRAPNNRQLALAAQTTGAYRLSLRAQDVAGNWSAWADRFTFRFDNTPPAPPAGLIHTAGIVHNVWQSSVADAAFTWQFSDPGIGTGGYDLYWGADPNGTSAAFVSAAHYTAGPPSAACASQRECVGYLRLRPRDTLNNLGAWQTHFILRYDAAPPVVADVSVITGGTGLGYAALPTGTTWISVTATDIGSGLSRVRVRVSNPGDQAGAWSPWIRYAGRFLWQLPGETEPVELCIQTQDTVGWESDEVCRIVTWSAPDVWQRFLPRMAQ